MDTLAPLAALSRTLAGLPPPARSTLVAMLGICPYGHPLEPGSVLVGWAPCTCSSAWAAHKGHRTTQCLTCAAHAITSVRYDPPHLGEGHPNRPSAPRQVG